MAPVGTLWTTDIMPTGKAVCSVLCYTYLLVFIVAQIKAVAAYGGIEIAFPESYEHYVDNKKPEFLSKFPHGKIPAWAGTDGFCLFEGYAIARYGESQR